MSEQPVTVAGGRVQTPLGSAPLIPVIMIMTGVYLMWFGVHYWRSKAVNLPSDPVKSVLQGHGLPVPDKQPPYQDSVYTGGGTVSDAGQSTSASATGSAIADDALKYVGQAYVYGGNADHPGNWDCSSFVSYVLGHDLGMPLPGGHWGDPGFPPHTHGPTTVQYLLYGTPINQDQVQAGDLVVWQTHVGIATSSSHLVSALGHAWGTVVTTIDGAAPTGETAHYRRVSAPTTKPESA